jgi:hypothetical protein
VKAPNLAMYQFFCSRHAEALELLRSCDRNEWETYERDCALAVASSSPPSSNPSSSSVPSSASTPDAASTACPASDESRLGRLRLHDYAIKPIQRICRYPLVLGQLLKFLEEAGVREDGRGLAGLKKAVEMTRKAAERVDRARRSREIECKTLLLASRMEGSAVSFLTTRGVSSPPLTDIIPQAVDAAALCPVPRKCLPRRRAPLYPPSTADPWCRTAQSEILWRPPVSDPYRTRQSEESQSL